MMPKKYVKKPIVIEAVQWTGNNRSEIFDFCSLSYVKYEFGSGDPILIIQTLEGEMVASKNDYIIKGIQGEFYPCKADIFKLTYDNID